ncbi:MAG TPA: DNRLRE domain-containing protein [Actinomycetota bacterium]|nr:DNRLRE domain-containing protein [Actinomycetota bacterium]
MKAVVRAGAASTLTAVLILGTLLPSSTASAATTTLTAAADAFVLSSSPTANRGATSPLRVRAGQKIAYVRFNVPPVDAGTNISSATLRMYALNASRCGTGGVQILRASNDTWGEHTIIWSNQPGSAGPSIASASWTGSGYRAFAVTAAVTAGQPVSFVIKHPDGCVASADTTFVSREASTNRPELVVETAGAVPPPLAPACSDGQDNDADGRIDLADPGCTDASDTDETDPPPPLAPACSDGQDNDADGVIDLADPGCTDASDTDETDPSPPAACDDGRDNDGDGAIDLADPGCAGPTDTDETDLAPGGGGPGGAIFSCQATGQVANVDPIVSPGQVAEHTHQFYGASPVHMTETSAELRTHTTTCVETDNRSAFWMPTVEEDGVRLLPGTTASGGGKHALIYYRCRHSESVCANMQPFPENFGHVSGNRHAMSAAENPVFRNGLGGWRCGTGGGAFSPMPPTTCSSGVLVAGVTFGNCLLPNGTLSDAVNSGCTSVGGRPILRIQQYFRFWVGVGTVGRITMGGGHLDPYQLHADYFFGWSTAASDNFMRICVNANRDCGTDPNV